MRIKVALKEVASLHDWVVFCLWMEDDSVVGDTIKLRELPKALSTKSR